MYRRKTAFLLWGFSALAILSLATGCSSSEKASAAPTPSAVPVVIATVSQRDMPLQVHAIGNVLPYATVQVKSQVNANLDQVHFREGQDVHKGDLLFTLDPRQIAADLAKAKGMLGKDQAQLANARATAQRSQQLLKEGVISQQAYDVAVADEGASVASVDADRAAIENEQVQLSYTKIYSPLDGRTGSLLANEGNLIKANADTAMVTINQINPIYVQFAIPEKDLAAVKRYSTGGKLKVQAIIAGDAEHAEVGDLSFIDNAVDPQTGTIKLKGSFANSDRRLWPGEFVDVVMTLTTEKNVVTVPTSALLSGQTGQYVYVVKGDMTAENRAVNVERTESGTAVVSQGLKPGEQVVVDGQVRLAPNTKVQIKSAAAGAQPGATPGPRAGE